MKLFKNNSNDSSINNFDTKFIFYVNKSKFFKLKIIFNQKRKPFAYNKIITHIYKNTYIIMFILLIPFTF